MVLAPFISSFLQNYWAFVGVYPTLFGIGAGISNVTVLFVGFDLFPGKKALVTGIMFASYSMSEFIFLPIMAGIINPDNLDPEKPEEGSKIGFFNWTIA